MALDPVAEIIFRNKKASADASVPAPVDGGKQSVIRDAVTHFTKMRDLYIGKHSSTLFTRPEVYFSAIAFTLNVLAIVTIAHIISRGHFHWMLGLLVILMAWLTVDWHNARIRLACLQQLDKPVFKDTIEDRALGLMTDPEHRYIVDHALFGSMSLEYVLLFPYRGEYALTNSCATLYNILMLDETLKFMDLTPGDKSRLITVRLMMAHLSGADY
jgi:hypothetical protein